MPSIDFRAVRSMISIGDVLELLHFKARATSGQQVRGACPLHGSAETSRVFSVNLAKNTFQCFKCQAKGNQLDLWAAATKKPLYDATVDLCQRLGRDIPWLTSRTEKRNP
jgi:DNA primase